jgi:hypothetical protein
VSSTPQRPDLNQTQRGVHVTGYEHSQFSAHSSSPLCHRLESGGIDSIWVGSGPRGMRLLAEWATAMRLPAGPDNFGGKFRSTPSERGTGRGGGAPSPGGGSPKRLFGPALGGRDRGNLSCASPRGRFCRMIRFWNCASRTSCSARRPGGGELRRRNSLLRGPG